MFFDIGVRGVRGGLIGQRLWLAGTAVYFSAKGDRTCQRATNHYKLYLLQHIVVTMIPA